MRKCKIHLIVGYMPWGRHVPDIQPTFAPDVIAQQQQIDQRRQIAQALMQRGMQDQGGTQMAGGVAIRNSPIAGLANALSAYTGGKMLNQTNKDSTDLANRRQQMLADTLKQGLANYQQDPMAAITTLAQNPDTAPYAQLLLKDKTGAGNQFGLSPVYLQSKSNPGEIIMAQPSQGGGYLANGKKIDESQYMPVLPSSVMNLGDRQVMVDRAGRQITSGSMGVSPTTVYSETAQNTRQQNQPIIAAQTDAAKSAITASNDAIKALAPIKSTIANIDDAIKAIDEGANTGVVASKLPSVQKASIELDNARSRLGLNVVQGTTFGALSEGELKLALDTALPTNLQPKDLKSWLIAKKSAQQKLASQLEDAAKFLGTPGATPAMYLEKNSVKTEEPTAAPAKYNR